MNKQVRQGSKLILITSNIAPVSFGPVGTRLYEGLTAILKQSKQESQTERGLHVYTCRLDLLENVGEEAATTVATAATTTYGYDGYMILEELYKHHVTILNFISIKNCINL